MVQDEINDDQTDTLELIGTQIAARLDRQFDSGEKIDNKSVALVGYAIAAASFLATRHAQPILAALAYVAYALAVGSGMAAFAVGAYRDVPDPRGLFNGYVKQSKPRTLAALSAERVTAFEFNVDKHRHKVQRWRFSLIALVLGVMFMVISIVVQTGHK